MQVRDEVTITFETMMGRRNDHREHITAIEKKMVFLIQHALTQWIFWENCTILLIHSFIHSQQRSAGKIRARTCADYLMICQLTSFLSLSQPSIRPPSTCFSVYLSVSISSFRYWFDHMKFQT